MEGSIRCHEIHGGAGFSRRFRSAGDSGSSQSTRAVVKAGDPNQNQPRDEFLQALDCSSVATKRYELLVFSVLKCADFSAIVFYSRRDERRKLPKPAETCAVRQRLKPAFMDVSDCLQRAQNYFSLHLRHVFNFSLPLAATRTTNRDASFPPSRMENQQHNDAALASRKVVTERKTFLIELKENEWGCYFRICEDVAGRRNIILLPSDTTQEFIDALQELNQFKSTLPGQE